MKRYILLALIICLLFSGCTVAEPGGVESAAVETTADPITTWDPFIGGFEYSAGRIFLQVIEGGEIPVYNIAYRHRDETIEVLEDMVSSYATWKLVGQRLYFVSGETLYAMDLPGGEHCIFEVDSQEYPGILRILVMEGDWLLCGAEKWEKNTDPMVLGDRVRVDTRIWVKLDFSAYYEDAEYIEN